MTRGELIFCFQQTTNIVWLFANPTVGSTVQNRSKPSPGRSPSFFFAKGQRWKIGERFIRIGYVGRLLVHHRNEDPARKRLSRESLTAIKSLQQFFKANRAILVTNL